MAMIDVCVENEVGPEATFAIPISELTHRVIGYYWRQVRPYAEHGILHQSSQKAAIPAFIAHTRPILQAKKLHTPEAAREVGDPDYFSLVNKVQRKLIHNPLTYLQTPNAKSFTGTTDFIFDSSAFSNKMTSAELDAIGWMIVLKPGVAHAMRELAGLIRPVIEIMWTDDVVRWNRHELETDDLAGFLFGSDRSSLAVVGPHLRDLQNNRCFYCDTKLPKTLHIDHVIPFSKVPLDGIANYVAADARCNLDKSATLPIREHTDRALARDKTDLASISEHTRVPVLLTRTQKASAGIYNGLPPGVPLWVGRGSYSPFGA
ncbi:HNH endonuclease [Hoyosella rhizosphaerae]|nr:HNH endonuclease [Hoyosella rhizosphaerae]